MGSVTQELRKRNSEREGKSSQDLKPHNSSHQREVRDPDIVSVHLYPLHSDWEVCYWVVKPAVCFQCHRKCALGQDVLSDRPHRT